MEHHYDNKLFHQLLKEHQYLLNCLSFLNLVALDYHKAIRATKDERKAIFVHGNLVKVQVKLSGTLEFPMTPPDATGA